MIFLKSSTISSIYRIQLFKERGFNRFQCRKCGRYFWSLEETDLCGDCMEYAFIGNTPKTKVDVYSMDYLRELYLRFFEKRGHARVNRYPVVARWRDDVYLVGASIYDFQPWVTEGIVPPPANPLVISQPCIRLTDIDKVGISGRHLTSFEMMAHHAFNTREERVYWNEETVRYSYEFFVEGLGIDEKELMYVEDWWSGGGNAGEDFEVLIRGLEVATLVFMHYKVMNEKLIEMENKIVDTGYGLERIYWLLKGTSTIYDAILGDIIDILYSRLGLKKVDERLLAEVVKKMGLMDTLTKEDIDVILNKISQKYGLEEEEFKKNIKTQWTIYRLVDHAKTLLLMLADGLVPSNTGGGYLARLLIRRAMRDCVVLGLGLSIHDIVELLIPRLSISFPEIREVEESVLDMVSIEEEKFKKTIKTGRKIVQKKVKSYRTKGIRELRLEDLILLYDSHGIPPEIVKEEAESLGVKVEVPSDFYGRLALIHEKSTPVTKGMKYRITPEMLSDINPTRRVYYEHPDLRESRARVLKVIDGKYLVLDRTIFYPEGGGAPADTGVITWKKGSCRVVDVQLIGNVIVHECEGDLSSLTEGEEICCKVDLERRKAIMRAHTATHIILAAARKVLGNHIWQAGAQKSEDSARLDITHFKRISREEVREIEELANKIIMDNRPVNVYELERNEAEKKYGFTLYQGGVIPERVIRVVDIEGWDAEACCGVHCSSTGKIGLVKIVKTERIQDGVERLEFITGMKSLKYLQDMEEKLKECSRILGRPVKEVVMGIKYVLDENKKLRKDLERLKERLIESIAHRIRSTMEKYEDIELGVQILREIEDLDQAIKLAFSVLKIVPKGVLALLLPSREGYKFIIALGNQAVEEGLDARLILKRLQKSIRLSGGGKVDLVQGFIRELEISKIVNNIKRAFKDEYDRIR